MKPPIFPKKIGKKDPRDLLVVRFVGTAYYNLSAKLAFLVSCGMDVEVPTAALQVARSGIRQRGVTFDWPR